MGIFSKLKQTFSSKKDGDRYLSGLDKSKKSFSERIRKLALGFTGVNEEFLEDLMVVLLEADIGIKTAQKIAVSYTHLDVYKRQRGGCPDCKSKRLSETGCPDTHA